MAEATRTETIVTATETRYTLVLDQEECDWLADLVSGARGSYGPSKRVWDALSSPKEGTAEPETFQEGDTVTVLPGARAAAGGRASFIGPAIVNWGPDTDGDYSVYQADGNDYAYVLPQYLVRR